MTLLMRYCRLSNIPRGTSYMPKTRAQLNKAVRQDALRDQLSAQGHVQHVVDITNKLSELEIPLDNLDVTRLKAAADIKIKLIDKYLPSLQSIHSVNESLDKTAEQYSDAELTSIATASSNRASKEKASKAKVH